MIILVFQLFDLLDNLKDIMEAGHAENVTYIFVEMAYSNLPSFGFGFTLELHKEPQTCRRNILQFRAINDELPVG